MNKTFIHVRDRYAHIPPSGKDILYLPCSLLHLDTALITNILL